MHTFLSEGMHEARSRAVFIKQECGLEGRRGRSGVGLKHWYKRGGALGPLLEDGGRMNERHKGLKVLTVGNLLNCWYRT